MQVIYHAQCRDGWCAAWIALKKFPDAELIPGFHGKPPPDVRGQEVLMLDFTYPRDAMEKIATDAKSFIVLDHHKTAQADTEGSAILAERAQVIFDMRRSGAGITWDYFNPGQRRPWIVDYVEDRDLWNHALPDTLAVSAYLSTLELSVEAWDRELEVGRLEKAVNLGTAIQSKIKQYLIEVKRNVMRVDFEGYNVPIVNAPPPDISELLSDLCTGEAFAIGWHQKPDGSFHYSMRSKEFDVSELAKRYSGGGHRNAASFRTTTMLTLPKEPSPVR